jgi:hypothetical protein
MNVMLHIQTVSLISIAATAVALAGPISISQGKAGRIRQTIHQAPVAHSSLRMPLDGVMTPPTVSIDWWIRVKPGQAAGFVRHDWSVTNAKPDIAGSRRDE